jgi:ABC-type lipoprotein export system ATPase subunit
VTHDQELARRARRAVVLRDGEVICDSTDVPEAISAMQAAEEKDFK